MGKSGTENLANFNNVREQDKVVGYSSERCLSASKGKHRCSSPKSS